MRGAPGRSARSSATSGWSGDPRQRPGPPAAACSTAALTAPSRYLLHHPPVACRALPSPSPRSSGLPSLPRGRARRRPPPP
ncbi:MAG: hypothetical protein FJ125_00170 [Deltaproteobacteria bacterium]|nr:hypothetical protein [Deltaproteobacteria bacterium]